MAKKQAGGMTRDQKSNFGLRGWVVIIFCAALFFMAGGTVNDAQNTIVPTFAQLYGWSTATMYTFCSVAAYVGMIGAVGGAILCAKKGVKLTFIVSLSLFAACFFVWGHITTLGQFVAVYCIIHITQNAFAQIGMSVIIADWFPLKKGLAMGWATMGANIGTALYVQIFTRILAAKGLPAAFNSFGVFVVLLVLVAIFFIKNRPEDCGCFPDNNREMTPEERDRLAAEGEAYKKTSPWTVKKLLSCKTVWLIGVAYGMIMMITMGTVSQLVPTIMSFGFSLEFSLNMMTVAALIGLVFSYLFGFLDAKIGTRKASLVFYLWTMLAVIFMALPGKWTVYPAVFFMGGFLGAGNNLTMSITSTVFGRYDFTKAWGVIYPITVIFRSAGYAVVGVLAERTGGYTVPYLVLLGVCIVCFILIFVMDDRMIGRNFVSEEELRSAIESEKK